MVATFAADYPVDAPFFLETDRDRLQDTESLYRGVELRLCGGVPHLSGLLRIGLDPLDLDQERTAQPAATFQRRGARGGGVVKRQCGRRAERLGRGCEGPAHDPR